MQQEAPTGVPSDGSRDGVVPSRADVSVADKLRTLADWLDAHPGANVSQVSFIDTGLGGPVRVTDYSAESPGDAEVRAVRIGGDWQVARRRTICECRAEVMPGFLFEIVSFALVAA